MVEGGKEGIKISPHHDTVHTWSYVPESYLVILEPTKESNASNYLRAQSPSEAQIRM